MNAPTAAAAALRTCGACMLCCKLLSIEELGKPPHAWCDHARPGAGCGIYAERPATCRAFACNFLTNSMLDEEWRPSRAKFILVTDAPNFKVVVDPAAPQAWRDRRYYPSLKMWSGRVREAGGLLLVVLERDLWVLLPEADIRVGSTEGARFTVLYRGPGASGPYVRLERGDGSVELRWPEGEGATP